MKTRKFLSLALVVVLALTACGQTKADDHREEESPTVTPAAVPLSSVEVAPNLDGIAYVVGDRADCKMDADMANAYIKAIEQAKEEWEAVRRSSDYYVYDCASLYVMLLDLAGDGWPVLLTVPMLMEQAAIDANDWVEELWEGATGRMAGMATLWGYRDGAAYPAVEKWRFDKYGTIDGEGLIYTTWRQMIEAPEDGDPSGGDTLYAVSNGEITLAHDIVEYENYYQYTSDYLKGSNGWYYYITDNGNNITREFLQKNTSIFGWDIASTLGCDIHIVENNLFEQRWPFGETYCLVDFTPADQAIAALRGWAAAPVIPKVKVILRLDTGDVKVDAAQGQPMNVPTNPTKEGYTFGGWYTDAALTVPWNFNTTVTGDMELYGKWVPLTSTAVTTGRSSQTITVNGEVVKLEAYTLAADSNGGDVTFVKLRDVAAVLDGSEAQFNVEWRNGAIYVATKSAYTTRNGTELQPIEVDGTGYTRNTSPVLFDGVTKALESIVITDVNDGGHTFFKLRDLADAIGFTVDWSGERGIFIETK